MSCPFEPASVQDVATPRQVTSTLHGGVAGLEHVQHVGGVSRTVAARWPRAMTRALKRRRSVKESGSAMKRAHSCADVCVRFGRGCTRRNSESAEKP